MRLFGMTSWGAHPKVEMSSKKFGPEPLTSDMIWQATLNFEQRQKCLTKANEEVAISSVSAPTKPKKFCKTCTKLCHPRYDHCLEHKDSSMDTSDMECTLQGCANPRSDHNTAAHKAHNPRNLKYKSNPPAPRSRASSRDRDGARSSPKTMPRTVTPSNGPRKTPRQSRQLH